MKTKHVEFKMVVSKSLKRKLRQKKETKMVQSDYYQSRAQACLQNGSQQKFFAGMIEALAIPTLEGC